MRLQRIAGIALAFLFPLSGCTPADAGGISSETVSSAVSQTPASSSAPAAPQPPQQREQTGIVTECSGNRFSVAGAQDGTVLTFSVQDSQQLPSLGETVQVVYLAAQDGTLTLLSVTQCKPAPLWAQYREKAEEMLSQLTLEQRVGQLFWIRCPQLSQQALEDIAAYQPGGLLLFGRDFADQSAEQIQQTIASYQNVSPIPLLVGADEEGGTVVRVSSNPQLRESPFLSPSALYQSGGMEAVCADAQEKSRLLLSLGVNVNLAPVCDVSTSPTDYIYSRTLGQDAQTTAEYVSQVVKVMEQEGIGSVLKHFPGYGDNADTHTGIAYDTRPYQQFEQQDFLPFQAGIQAGAPCVLVSHNVVASMDAQWPASLSPQVHEILREQLEFEGVILTDDLVMDAIREYTDGESAAVQAVRAGNDMLIVTDYPQQIPAVLEAVKAGELSQQQIDSAVVRILCWKMSLGLLALASGDD